jgi:hypothetical protein
LNIPKTMRLTPTIALCVVACGCTTLDPSRDHIDRLYVGIVHVVTPSPRQNDAAAGSPVVGIDAEGVGFGIQDGVVGGYFHDRHYVAPSDCRVVIFVKTDEQLEQIAQRFAEMKEGVCGTLAP